MEKSMISLCLLGGLAIGNGFAQTPSKPNILLIIADDCSYYDIGCFGAVNNKTPHIDALARQGIKFNSAYNSVSMSTPTRHCVYTGMYPMHHGGYANHSSVNADVKSLPTYLGNLGYRVGLAGKWHIKPLANFPFEDVPGFPKDVQAQTLTIIPKVSRSLWSVMLPNLSALSWLLLIRTLPGRVVTLPSSTGRNFSCRHSLSTRK